MQQVSAEWKAYQQRDLVPESFVEISYRITDPSIENDGTESDNGHAAWATPSDVVNESIANSGKYIVLEKNSWLLNGTNRIYTAENFQHTGFVSPVLSKADGTFDANPVITITFQNYAEEIPGFRLLFSTAFNEWAENFTVTASDSVYGTVLYRKNVYDNTLVDYGAEERIEGCNRVEIEIKKWSHPFHRVRLEQVFMGVIKVFGKADLLGYTHEQNMDLNTFDLPKTQIMFEISNVDGQFNPDNPEGVYQYLRERQQITVRYGYLMDRDTNQIEWIKAGTFWLCDWQTPQNGISATFTARDVLEFMGGDCVLTAGTSYTLKALAEEALSQSDIPTLIDGSNRWHIDDALAAITINLPADFHHTCAEVVQFCANAACCVMYQDRDGILQIVPLAVSMSDYIINQYNSYKNAEYETRKPLKSVSVNNGQGIAYNSNAGEVQTVENPLVRNSTVATAVAGWIKDVLKNRRTLSGEYRADPRLDVGDEVRVDNKYTDNIATIITNVKYTYNGAFRGSYQGQVIV